MRADDLRNVVYACDDNYIEQTIISIVSLLKHSGCGIKIWIISDYISEYHKKFIENHVLTYKASLEFVNIEQVLSGILLVTGSRHPRTVYAKLFLEQVVDAERLLYLDSDTIVTGNLDLLWERNMENELVAGVEMPYSQKVKERMNIKGDVPYLCDGIVILNLELWRKNKVGEQCRKHIVKHNGAPPMLSEGTLNCVCQDSIGVLEPKYNLMPAMILYSSNQMMSLFKASYYYTEDELEIARKSPIIVHFINELFNRPWLDPCDHPFKNLYRDIRMRIFGEIPYKKQKLTKNTRMTRTLRTMLPFALFAKLYHIKHKDI